MTLDSRIHSRIHSELQFLREEEEQVRHEIEAALQKENLDREIAMTMEGEDRAPASSSTIAEDLQELESTMARRRNDGQGGGFAAVQSHGAAVRSCYQ